MENPRRFDGRCNSYQWRTRGRLMMADVIAKRSAKLENLYVFNVLCKLEVVQWIKGPGEAGAGRSLVMEEIDRSRRGTTLVMPSIKCHKQQRAHDNARLHDARSVKVSSNNKCYIYLYNIGFARFCIFFYLLKRGLTYFFCKSSYKNSDIDCRSKMILIKQRNLMV